MKMRTLKKSKIVNEINMIIKKVDKENNLNNIIYISKNDEEKQLEFITYTQILVKKNFNLILSLKKEENGKVFKHEIERFILNENGFQILNNDESDKNGVMGETVQTLYKCITYQSNNELTIRVNFLFQEGLYELTFSLEDENNEEKVLSIYPFEVIKK